MPLETSGLRPVSVLDGQRSAVPASPMRVRDDIKRRRPIRVAPLRQRCRARRRTHQPALRIRRGQQGWHQRGHRASVAFTEPDDNGRQQVRVLSADGPAARHGTAGTALGEGRTGEAFSAATGWPGAGLAADPFSGDGVTLGKFLQDLTEERHTPERDSKPQPATCSTRTRSARSWRRDRALPVPSSSHRQRPARQAPGRQLDLDDDHHPRPHPRIPTVIDRAARARPSLRTSPKQLGPAQPGCS
jgi:hypothetical protein